VEKLTQDERTLTVVEDLIGEARLKELAEMMGELSEGTLQSAREMLQNAGSLVEPERG
jgi:DNA repair ATPase RecN